MILLGLKHVKTLEFIISGLDSLFKGEIKSDDSAKMTVVSLLLAIVQLNFGSFGSYMMVVCYYRHLWIIVISFSKLCAHFCIYGPSIDPHVIEHPKY